PIRSRCTPPRTRPTRPRSRVRSAPFRRRSGTSPATRTTRRASPASGQSVSATRTAITTTTTRGTATTELGLGGARSSARAGPPPCDEEEGGEAQEAPRAPLAAAADRGLEREAIRAGPADVQIDACIRGVVAADHQAARGGAGGGGLPAGEKNESRAAHRAPAAASARP